MKTATDWKQIWRDDREPIDNTTFEQRLTERIEAIQLDAWRQGMTDAAELVMAHKWQKDSSNFNQGFMAGAIKHKCTTQQHEL